MQNVSDTEIVCIILESIQLPNHLVPTCSCYQAQPVYGLVLKDNFDVGESG